MNHPGEPFSIFDPENHKQNKMVCFKLPRFWVLCYVSVDICKKILGKKDFIIFIRDGSIGEYIYMSKSVKELVSTLQQGMPRSSNKKQEPQ